MGSRWKMRKWRCWVQCSGQTLERSPTCWVFSGAGKEMTITLYWSLGRRALHFARTRRNYSVFLSLESWRLELCEIAPLLKTLDSLFHLLPTLKYRHDCAIIWGIIFPFPLCSVYVIVVSGQRHNLPPPLFACQCLIKMYAVNSFQFYPNPCSCTPTPFPHTDTNLFLECSQSCLIHSPPPWSALFWSFPWLFPAVATHSAPCRIPYTPSLGHLNTFL